MACVDRSQPRYVRSQALAHQQAAFDELTAAVVEAGWPHTSVVSMKEAEEELEHQGLWSFLPWIWLSEKKRASKRSANERWVLFLEPATMVKPRMLERLLSGFDARESWYLGRALHDDRMSIIHHYQQEPPYALAHSGFAACLKSL